MLSLTVMTARRLALVRAGLLKPEWTGLPRRGGGFGRRARSAAHAVIARFGYLQLDSVVIAGARSHVLVLLSRVENLEPGLAEALLAPGEPLFEYWGHEASWLPMELYPLFGFRRREFVHHPWYGDVLGENPKLVRQLLSRIRREGELRSVDLESPSQGWWNIKPLKKVALALWSSGQLAISKRHNFLRSFDLPERVIPTRYRETKPSLGESIRALVLRALAGHGWATASTLRATWRLKGLTADVDVALADLEEAGEIMRCQLRMEDGNTTAGWIRSQDLELAGRVERLRPRTDTGVLLSPFDPLLWDRQRVKQLFGFDQVLEIYKPKAQRKYGYYCLPVLAGEKLVARVDLKFRRAADELDVLSCHLEDESSTIARAAVVSALGRYTSQLGCAVASLPG